MRSVPPYRRGGTLSMRGATCAIFMMIFAPARIQRVQCSKVPRRCDNTNYNEFSLTNDELQLLGARGARGNNRSSSRFPPDARSRPHHFSQPVGQSLFNFDHSVREIVDISRQVPIFKTSFLAPGGT